MKKTIKTAIHFLIAGLVLGACTGSAKYLDKNVPTDERISDLLGRLTLEEKVTLLGGDSTGFNSAGIPRLGILPIKMSDGPVGVRTGVSTAFPVSVNMAASWDTALINRYGVALAEETKAKGKICILGPCVGIHRYPLNGRNFESFGEDPWLSSRMAVNYIKGVQSQNVIATVKHFACNDQEWERNNYDVAVDERTLHEIHLAPFEAAVKEAHVWALMSAYNIVNGQHCSENKQLLTDILKGEWGFRGLVMSDWVSVYSADKAANNGLDIEMPQPVWMKDSLLAAIKDGRVTEETINDKVRRHLRVRFEAGYFDNPLPVENQKVIESDSHRALALEMAEKSLVLVKNSGLLPLQLQNVKSIAMIGPSANIVRSGGGGSSMVNPWVSVSPYAAMVAIAGKNTTVTYAEGIHIDPVKAKPFPAKYLLAPDGKTMGLQAQYFTNKEWAGEPAITRIDTAIDYNFGTGSPDPSIKSDNFSARWTGKLIAPATGNIRFTISSDDGSFLYINNKLVADNGGNHGETPVSCELQMVKNQQYDIRVDFSESGGDAVMRFGWQNPSEVIAGPSIEKAVKAAKAADIAVVCVGNAPNFESEGADVADFNMPLHQDELVQAVSKANPNTIVVLYGGTSIAMTSWLNNVKAVIVAGYPGQEGGTALAKIITGSVNPSGKLPYSYIQQCGQSPSCDAYAAKSLKISYDEGVFVGYRNYDKNNIAPLFPFGFGLSYTSFDFSNLKVEKSANNVVTVNVDVKNTGAQAGEEVVQLYVSQKICKVARPVKELKAFAKIKLNVGEQKTVTMTLSNRAFQYWSPENKGWTLDPGNFEIAVGSSSRDIKLKNLIKIE